MRRALSAAAACAVVALVAACGGGGNNNTGAGGTSGAATPTTGATSAPATGGASGTPGGAALPDLKGQSLTVMGEWGGNEQKNFQKVLAAFEDATGAKITYQSAGDEIATKIGTAVAGGNPPDVALLPQPGVIQGLVNQGAAKPLPDAIGGLVDQHFAPGWKDLGTFNGKFYAVWFKAANKSTVWYNTKVFDDAGVQPPKTWDDFMKAADTIANFGVTPVSIGGADGWTLTDWFENVYIRTAGPQMYDKLAKHEIKWTDPSVTKALQVLQQLWSQQNLIAGGTQGAVNTDFPTSVSQVFAKPPKAAIVYEGDFAAANIATAGAKVGTDAKFFDFPSIDGSASAVVGGGDGAVAFNDKPATMALMGYFASPESATIWVKAGGFTSPNKSVDLAAYPDDTSRQIAQALTSAQTFRFDMSDLAPGAFGGTKGAGEWKDLQDFLANPSNIQGAQQALERDAAKAYG
jgi:ABC-type glycerol-3-phosphate transport system substrate-binding protein